MYNNESTDKPKYKLKKVVPVCLCKITSVCTKSTEKLAEDEVYTPIGNTEL